jgi:hypothetical protein
VAEALQVTCQAKRRSLVRWHRVCVFPDQTISEEKMIQSSEIEGIESRLCASLDRMREQAEIRLRSLSDVVAKKPIWALGVAFLSGFVIARVLQKLG